MDIQQIDLRNDLAELERLGQFIETFGEAHGLSPKVLYGINLVLDELVTNIISYGYTDQAAHTITLRLMMNDGEFTAELEDDARAFNPLDMPEPDLTVGIEDRKIGGLGIHFARKTMDELEYRRQQDRNLLVMKKRAHP